MEFEMTQAELLLTTVYGLGCLLLGVAAKDMGQPIKWNAVQIVYVILSMLIISLPLIFSFIRNNLFK